MICPGKLETKGARAGTRRGWKKGIEENSEKDESGHYQKRGGGEVSRDSAWNGGWKGEDRLGTKGGNGSRTGDSKIFLKKLLRPGKSSTESRRAEKLHGRT